MLACFPNGIAKIATISELPNIFAHFFRKILSKMFCRQSSAVEGCAGPPHYHGATLFSGANAVSALYFISWYKFITFVLYALVQ